MQGPSYVASSMKGGIKNHVAFIKLFDCLRAVRFKKFLHLLKSFLSILQAQEDRPTFCGDRRH